MSYYLLMRRYIFLLLLLLPFPATAADFPLPPGWHIPTKAELQRVPSDYSERVKAKHRYMKVEADFDRDGARDVARLLADKDGKAAVFVTLAMPNARFRQINLCDRVPQCASLYAASLGVTVAKPGKYTRADDVKNASFTLTKPELLLQKFEAWKVVFYWDGKAGALGTFSPIWTYLPH